MSYKDIPSTSLHFTGKQEKRKPWMDDLWQRTGEEGKLRLMQQAREEAEQAKIQGAKEAAIREKLTKYRAEEEEIERQRQLKNEQRLRAIAEMNAKPSKKDVKDKKKRKKDDKKGKKAKKVDKIKKNNKKKAKEGKRKKNKSSSSSESSSESDLTSGAARNKKREHELALADERIAELEKAKMDLQKQKSELTGELPH
eukprot:gnl/MRDRNA2_/MRDRNA2_109423_c0_seq1.p2 gnl/MRDRNA2_/MRDRNA2_109423_c0~~gnl/MRDRNA2_/MRDRNA2_109423_c0_seq1.p2  ORF type:complete len:198 (-),score=64.02 gnl/MRDRNA2_/MRDRNA2_109423_c0_seq1:27-620(-)